MQQLIATRLPLMTCLACKCSPRPIGVPQVQQARRVTGAAKQRDAARCAIERVRQANADGRQCEELAFVAEGQV